MYKTSCLKGNKSWYECKSCGKKVSKMSVQCKNCGTKFCNVSIDGDLKQ